MIQHLSVLHVNSKSNKSRPTLKNCLFLSTRIAKKTSPGWSVKLFFTLFKLNITFYVKFYLNNNCSVNLN